jgi:hypothetical protein
MTTQVIRPVLLPTPPPTQEDLSRWLRDVLLPALARAFTNHLHVYPQGVQGELRVKEYTVATRPAAGDAGAGAIIFVSDGGAGAVFQGSTGSAWVNLG